MIARSFVWTIALSGLVLAPAGTHLRPVLAAQIKDAESAAHGFEAASYQVKDTYPFPDCKLIQLELGVLSHYSYLLVSGTQALVVDPGRDVTSYIELAAKEARRLSAST